MELDLLMALKHSYQSLNPYYNGRYSWRTTEEQSLAMFVASLNPYYNGRYSWRVAPCTIYQ